jgi:putative phosphoribosyl transferase
MRFADRDEAARVLAERLAPYRGRSPLVLAVPRGAVPMASRIADALDGDLDVVLVHKLGAPGNPEYAIGAVEENGHVTLNPDARRLASDDVLREEVRAQLERLHERRRRYSAERPAHDPAGRVVIVVDDGVATGSTMLAALHALRQRGPERLVAAVGVAPRRTLQKLASAADEVVCAHAADAFLAVGGFFEHFPQVEDDDVERLLREAAGPGPASGHAGLRHDR